mmetsp:Transcript_23366/g.59917  ORF Transcript_23366/g.59917 Transcript_23366/m.59917 type:complete len:391 (-) Transcript_23366:303-1475(-)
MGRNHALKTPRGKARKETGAQGKQSRPQPTKAKGKAKRGDSEHHAADNLDEQLAAVGLGVKETVGDGNCLFRAIADQIYGEDETHMELRARAVAYMRQRPDDFQPFIEDDEAFGDYLERMAQDGQWAGHLELQALSLLLRANINVHQAEQPVWVISNFPADAASLHLSYHLGEHYNSVRLKEDIASSKPAAHITLGSLPAAVGSSGADMHGPPGEARAAESSSSSSRGAGGAQQVAQEGGPAALGAAEGAPEELTREAGSGSPAGGRSSLDGECTKLPPVSPGSMASAASPVTAPGPRRLPDRTAHLPKPPGSRLGNGTSAAAGAAEPEAPAPAPHPPKKEKPVGRNRACPCGSKQKYKNCCGRPGRGAPDVPRDYPGASAGIRLQTLSI